MSDLQNYFHAQERTAHARTRYDAAAKDIDLCMMRQRCFEAISQHEPINGLGLEREAALRLVRFIMTGRVE